MHILLFVLLDVVLELLPLHNLHIRHQVGLLLGEIDELLEVCEAAGHFAHSVHIAVELVHHKARLADGVDVAVHRAGSP